MQVQLSMRVEHRQLKGIEYWVASFYRKGVKVFTTSALSAAGAQHQARCWLLTQKTSRTVAPTTRQSLRYGEEA